MQIAIIAVGAFITGAIAAAKYIDSALMAAEMRRIEAYANLSNRLQYRRYDEL